MVAVCLVAAGKYQITWVPDGAVVSGCSGPPAAPMIPAKPWSREVQSAKSTVFPVGVSDWKLSQLTDVSAATMESEGTSMRKAAGCTVGVGVGVGATVGTGVAAGDGVGAGVGVAVAVTTTVVVDDEPHPASRANAARANARLTANWRFTPDPPPAASAPPYGRTPPRAHPPRL